MRELWRDDTQEFAPVREVVFYRFSSLPVEDPRSPPEPQKLQFARLVASTDNMVAKASAKYQGNTTYM